MAIEHALPFFKAFADETRLRIVGLLATRDHSVDELAALLNVRPPTVSHHLHLLRELQLVTMRQDKNSHLYALNTDRLRTVSRDVLSLPQPERLADEVEADAWQRKVLRDFLSGERLEEIPASRKKRGVILEWLTQHFEPNRRYKETEVNELIKRHHDDAATLRRELVGAGLLLRQDSVYWRPASS